MTKTLAHVAELEIHTCPTCFIVYAFPTAMSERKQESGDSWYCPNGHSISFTTSTKAKLEEMRRERDRLKQNEAYLEERLKDRDLDLLRAQRSTAALKGEVTKIRKRVGNGVCPCCNRTFQNLARHMSVKHAGFELKAV